jgi:hypothetical protein
MTTFTLRLISLTCDRGQELNGDEIYLKKDGETVFNSDVIGVKFDDEMRQPKRTSAFDFRTCSFLTPGGPVTTSAYQPNQFIYGGLNAPVNFELWENDQQERLRGADDLIGKFTLTDFHFKEGEDSITLNGRNARYTLSYLFTRD